MTDETLFDHALDLSRRGQDQSAGRILTRLAEAGDAEAAVHLGKLFGLSFLPSNIPRQSARAWYRRAAKGGNLRGTLEYAGELDDPDEGDPEEAKRWYAVARKEGCKGFPFRPPGRTCLAETAP